VATLALCLCAGGAQAGTYVIDNFESGGPVSLFAYKNQDDRIIQTGLPVFSGVREVGVSGGDTTASRAYAELLSAPGDDGMRFTGTDGNLNCASGGVMYRSQTDWYHGMDFDALALADRFYVKLSEDPGTGIGFQFCLQDQDGFYSYGGLTLDGSGYLELPFSAFSQEEPFPAHPDFHHVSAFGFQVNFFNATTESVTVSEFGITGVPEPASAVLLAVGGLAMLLLRRRHVRNWLRMGN
jgi:hypothetical protein